MKSSPSNWAKIKSTGPAFAHVPCIVIYSHTVLNVRISFISIPGKSYLCYQLLIRIFNFTLKFQISTLMANLQWESLLDLPLAFKWNVKLESWLHLYPLACHVTSLALLLFRSKRGLATPSVVILHFLVGSLKKAFWCLTYGNVIFFFWLWHLDIFKTNENMLTTYVLTRWISLRKLYQFQALAPNKLSSFAFHV
jgi:hypothetical protein